LQLDACLWTPHSRAGFAVRHLPPLPGVAPTVIVGRHVHPEIVLLSLQPVPSRPCIIGRTFLENRIQISSHLDGFAAFKESY